MKWTNCVQEPHPLAPKAEASLWVQLCEPRFKDAQFFREHLIGPFIADFVSLRYHLIIEIDGGRQIHQLNHHIQRGRYFSSLGFNTLRFWDYDIINRLDEVLSEIEQYLDSHQPEDNE